MPTIAACCKCSGPVDIPDEVVGLVQGLGEPMCPPCLEALMGQGPALSETPVVPRESLYQFTEDMGEISGFGGGYEQTCRNMVVAGLEWFDAHPEAQPAFRGFKEIYGVLDSDNDDAKALSAAVVAGADGDCTGAMHQATVGHVLWIKKNGWEAYCIESRKRCAEKWKGS